MSFILQRLLSHGIYDSNIDIYILHIVIEYILTSLWSEGTSNNTKISVLKSEFTMDGPHPHGIQ